MIEAVLIAALVGLPMLGGWIASKATRDATLPVRSAFIVFAVLCGLGIWIFAYGMYSAVVLAAV